MAEEQGTAGVEYQITAVHHSGERRVYDSSPTDYGDALTKLRSYATNEWWTDYRIEVRKVSPWRPFRKA